MVRRTKEDAEKTREILLNAAEQIFVEKGVASTSLEEIARAAGLTRGAVYWHFKNKQELFSAMHERVKLPMDELFEKALNDEDPLQALEELCVQTLKTLAKNKSMQRVFTILLFKCEPAGNCRVRLQDRREEVVGRFKKVLTSAYKQGRLAPGIDPVITAISLHSYMTGIFSDYLRNSEVYKLSKLSASLVSLFFKAIRQPVKV